jgi:hypothetical protein
MDDGIDSGSVDVATVVRIPGTGLRPDRDEER